MTYDSTNTGDDWDSYVPTPPPAPQTALAPTDGRSPVASQNPGTALGMPIAPKQGGGFNMRLLGIPIVLGMLAIGAITNRGTTTADDLQPGDCFIMPSGDGEFSRLNTEDCALPHDGQILSVATVASSGPYPGDFDIYWNTVYNSCESSLSRIVRLDAMPDDTELNFFSPTESSWKMDDRESLCYIHSPGGLDGSFVGVLGN